MTSKEKAEELVKLFYYPSLKWALKHAKECATKCVDEILKSNPTNPLKGGYIKLYSDMVDEAIEYWQQVKTEIETL